ncbi:MAG: hypothetical protein ACYDA2_01895 [Acidimicrobiales bacterium]
MSTLEDVKPVGVELGGVRGGPDVRTLRRDPWWRFPAATVSFLTVVVVYLTWAVFQNAYYFVGSSQHRDLISPLYSPCITGSCVPGAHGTFLVLHWWMITPALLALIIPGGFRMTCYYYRKAYYRSFWQSPPACGVADGHAAYSGETRFPLIFQNLHRYFWYLALVYNVILTIDAVMAFRMPGQGGIGVSIGTLVLVVNAVFLWLYSGSCHFCRHICGGNVNRFSKHPLRHRLWKLVTPLNARHMEIAWLSLFWVTFADVYVRLVASGWISDPKLF